MGLRDVLTMGRAASFQTAGTTVTASVTPNTKGSWITLVASTPFDSHWFQPVNVGSTNVSSTDTGQLMDIGIGSAGNEKILIPNIPTGFAATRRAGPVFPVLIPSGSRISARLQAVIASDVCDPKVLLYGKLPWQGESFQKVDEFGAVTSSASAGTDLSGGGIVELVASTVEDYKAFGYCFDLGVGALSGGGTRIVEIFVGVGAAEKSLIKDINVETGGGENLEKVDPSIGFYPMTVDVPAGTRIAAQAVGTKDIGIVVYGFR